MPRRRQTEVQELTPASVQKIINDRWGEGTMKRASDPSLQIVRVPCGILSVDLALEGGFARGRYAEAYGPYSVGKTLLALYLIANAQRLGHRAAYVDAEGTFDPVFASHIGVDVEELEYQRPEHGQRAIDAAEILIRSGLYTVVVFDSIAAMLPKAELESDMEAGTMGTHLARLMSAGLRKLTTANQSQGSILFFINQQRESIGSIFHKKMVTTGGRAMAFYSGTRLELVRTENIERTGKIVDPKTGELKDGKIIKGHRVLVRVEKDKTGVRPHTTTTFVYDYDRMEVDHLEDLMYLGRVTGLVHKRGNRWWIEGYEDTVANGRARFKSWLRRNQDEQDWLEHEIRQAYNDRAATEEEPDGPDE